MIDYHLHLWSHDDSSVGYRLDQVAKYCEEAAKNGVSELALTEHLFRFVELRETVGEFWNRAPDRLTSRAMADYFDFHARNSLEEYVTFAELAKSHGLPIKIGLEVDYYPDHMSAVADLLARYPFDVLIGSVHWLDTWQFDDIDNAVHVEEWRTRDVDECWETYTRAFEEMTAARCVDVLAHPDVIKVANFGATDPEPFWRRMADAAHNADVSVECSSAGWFKPVAEQYPSDGLLSHFVAKGLTFTTASDAHHLEAVGRRVSDLADLLEVHGVHELATYTQRRRMMVPLRGGS